MRSRRRLRIGGGAALALALAAAGGAAAHTLDPADPDDALEIRKRIACAPVDGEPQAFGLTGKVYARVPGERDRHLFDVEGMGVRRCIKIADPVRGPGYRVINREIVFYLDPETGAILRTWDNPWTGETVTVLPIANDPVIFDRWARRPDGSPQGLSYTRKGDWAFVQRIVPLFYDNPMGGDYQDYVGNKYHAMEMFTATLLAEPLLSHDGAGVSSTTAWTRISDWMPWMKMGGRPGTVIFTAVSATLENGAADLPDHIREEIEANHPVYLDAPPADDARPNDTTWTVVKRHIDAERAASGETAPAAGH